MPQYPEFAFDITHKSPDNLARLGRLKTPHGTIETPNFIFCGTKAAIRGATAHQMRDLQTDIILSNTYHLMIQPGPDVIAKAGGLHKFMGWDGPMLTDSGGFQIFSMGHGGVADEIKGRNRGNIEKSLISVKEEGATFRSYMNGEKLFLSPEISVDIQRKLGTDLMMPLDECTAFHVDREYTAKSMERSHRWEDRSLKEFNRGNDGSQAIYGIVQGGVYEDLRKESCEYTRDRDFFGTAVGGSLGGSKEQFYDVVGMCGKHIHPERPVHLLGIGAIEDIFACIRLGIDTFDCVSPTRIARHGWALVKGAPKNRVNIRNAQFREDSDPIKSGVETYVSRNFSMSYLHHLMKAGELLGSQLVAMHNIEVMNTLMREIRAAIKDDTLDTLEKEWIVQ